MNDDQGNAFEERLRAQALSPIPPAWRESILPPAPDAASASPTAPQRAGHLAARLRSWLWPSPFAWGGLTALWVAIAALNRLSTFEPTAPSFAVNLEPRALVSAMREQRREIDALLAPASADVLHPPVNRPRSELASTNRMA